MSIKNQVQSFWKFDHEHGQINSVQVFLWAKGLCITGHDSEGNLLAGVAYSYDQVYELKVLENLILNEPLLADATLVRHVCMSVSRHLVIPKPIMNEIGRDELDIWLRHIHNVEYDEELSTSHNQALDIGIIYPKKKIIRSILSQYFPERQSKFYVAPAELLGEKSEGGVIILLLDMHCSVTFYRKGQLEHFTIIDWIEGEDIFMAVHQIAESLNINPQNMDWRLGGVSRVFSHIDEALSSYISEAHYQVISPEATFKSFSLCE